MRQNAKELEAVLFDLGTDAVIQLSVRRAVDDQTHLSGVQPHLVDHFGDSRHGLNAPAGAVGNQKHGVHMGKRPPGDMLQPRLVVHDNIGIVGQIFSKLRLQYAVDIAVAALALGTTHDQHVKIVVLDQGVAELHFRVVRLGHPLGNGAFQLRLRHFLANLAEGGLYLHAKNLVQVGIGIGVHHKDGAALLAAQVVDDHAAGSGFAHTTLSGNGNGMRCHSLVLLKSDFA